MDHNLINHNEKLNELCRLCGKRVLTQAEKRRGRKKLPCNYATDVFMIFDLFVKRDRNAVH